MFFYDILGFRHWTVTCCIAIAMGWRLHVLPNCLLLHACVGSKCIIPNIILILSSQLSRLNSKYLITTSHVPKSCSSDAWWTSSTLISGDATLLMWERQRPCFQRSGVCLCSIYILMSVLHDSRFSLLDAWMLAEWPWLHSGYNSNE